MEEEKDFLNMKLDDIRTSNTQDEDTPLVGDFSLFKFCGARLFLCYLVSLLPIAISFLVPRSSITLSNKVRFDKNELINVGTEFSGLSKKSRFVTLSLGFDGFSEQKKFQISGVMTITKVGKKEDSTKVEIKQQEMVVSQINWMTQQLPLYHDNYVNYDKLKISMTLECSGYEPNSITFYLQTAEVTYDLLDTAVRITVSMIFLILACYHGYTAFGAKLPTTLEQHITALLYIAIVLYTDPITALLKNTSTVYQNICKNIFYAYASFYLLSLLTYFPRVRTGSQNIIVAPLIVSAVFLVIFLTTDFLKPNINHAMILPSSTEVSHKTSSLFIGYFGLFGVIYVIFAFIASKSVEEIQQFRFKNYVSISISFLMAFGLFIFFSQRSTSLQDSSLSVIFPISIVTLFGLVMFHYHQSAGKDYEMIEEMQPAEESNPIGVDQDDTQLDMKEKLQKV